MNDDQREATRDAAEAGKCPKCNLARCRMAELEARLGELAAQRDALQVRLDALRQRHITTHGEVQRYDIDHYGDEREQVDGFYVRYSALDLMRAERDALQGEELAEAKSRIAQLESACDWVLSKPDGYRLIAEADDLPDGIWVESGGDSISVPRRSQ